MGLLGCVQVICVLYWWPKQCVRCRAQFTLSCWCWSCSSSSRLLCSSFRTSAASIWASFSAFMEDITSLNLSNSNSFSDRIFSREAILVLCSLTWVVRSVICWLYASFCSLASSAWVCILKNVKNYWHTNIIDTGKYNCTGTLYLTILQMMG